MAKRKNPSSGKGPGYWYYVWFYPRWELLTFKDDLGHVSTWQKRIVPMLLKHYHRKTTIAEQAELDEVYRAMPRGRVIEVGNDFMLAHGNDFPSNKDTEIERLVSIFGLTNCWLTGRAWAQFDRHEIQLVGHVRTFERSFALIPGELREWT